MGIFLLRDTWVHEYLAIFVRIYGHCMWGHFKSWRHVILTKLGQHVNEMMSVAVKNFQIILWSHFLIIRQNMATNAILQ